MESDSTPCRRCGQPCPELGFFCPNCGRPSWGPIIAAFVFAVILLVGSLAIGAGQLRDGKLVAITWHFWVALVGGLCGAIWVLSMFVVATRGVVETIRPSAPTVRIDPNVAPPRKPDPDPEPELKLETAFEIFPFGETGRLAMDSFIALQLTNETPYTTEIVKFVVEASHEVPENEAGLHSVMIDVMDCYGSSQPIYFVDDQQKPIKTPCPVRPFKRYRFFLPTIRVAYMILEHLGSPDRPALVSVGCVLPSGKRISHTQLLTPGRYLKERQPPRDNAHEN